MTFCTAFILEEHTEFQTKAKPLKCRSWQCELCRPDRAKELIAQAIRGKATKFLTLTVSRNSGSDPNDRARNLVKAWRKLRSEIAANLSLPRALQWQTEFLDSGGKRFKRKSRAKIAQDDLDINQPAPSFVDRNPRWPAARRALREATRSKETMRKHSIEFLAVVEAQKNGEAHLHIIMRSPTIPVEWISARMDELIAAPIVWIENVAGSKKLANYVAKYCGKDPHRFGTLKRYWSSKNWCAKWQRQNVTPCENAPYYTRSPITLDQWTADHRRMRSRVTYERPWLVARMDCHPLYDETPDDA